MADYIFTILSRPVKTKDNSEFVRVFQDLGFEGGSGWAAEHGHGTPAASGGWSQASRPSLLH